MRLSAEFSAEICRPEGNCTIYLKRRKRKRWEDWGDASVSQGMPKIDGHPKELGRSKKGFSSTSFRGSMAPLSS